MKKLSRTEYLAQKERDAQFAKLQKVAEHIGMRDAEKQSKKKLHGYDGKLMPSQYLKIESAHKEMRKMIAAQDRYNREHNIRYTPPQDVITES